ncbi:hypothetical protein BVRB_6g132900 [Beta vulgaris subsp. vulgaris]|nr:hypothetical protein BVRB_6g132900 [Beta vulgaris subsp. vulgaris]
MNNPNTHPHHHHGNPETNILRRVGIQIESEDHDTNQDDYILYNTVLGKVKDLREFTEQQIADWVTTSWTTHDMIQVKKVGKIFFFLCSDDRDRASLLDLSSANFQGALILFTKCEPQNSFNSHSFQRIPIWIKVEGLPLLYNKLNVARRALEKLGTVLYFDSDSMREGFKDFLRAKVLIPINNPLVPGVYFNRQEGPRIWIDFRYEGVFIFCSKCGRIGHKRPRCRIPMAIAKRHFAMVLEDIGQGIFLPIVSPFVTPLFTNKLIGLKRVERLRTTHVNLVQLSEERDKDGDSLSEQTLDDNHGNDDSSSSDSSSNDDPAHQNNEDLEGQDSNKEGEQNPSRGKALEDYHAAGPSKRKRVHDSGNQHVHKRLRHAPPLHHASRILPCTGVHAERKSSSSMRHLLGRQKPQGTVEDATAKFKVQGNSKLAKSNVHSMRPNTLKRKEAPAGIAFKKSAGKVKKKRKRSEELMTPNHSNHLPQDLNRLTPGKCELFSASLFIGGMYNIILYSQRKGSIVIPYSNFFQKHPDVFFQSIFSTLLLALLLKKRVLSAYSPSADHLASTFFSYLYLPPLIKPLHHILFSKNSYKTPKMASSSSVHPVSSHSSLESEDNDHHLAFLPPYEAVNLASLFTNVQIVDDDRFLIPRDPYSDFFIPFGSLTYLDAISPSHSAPFDTEPLDEEINTFKNPPNSPVLEFDMPCSNSFDPLNLEMPQEDSLQSPTENTRTFQEEDLSKKET